MDEFEIIQRYFFNQSTHREDVQLGIGDDAAILRVPPGQDLVTSVDTLVAGVHFPEHLKAAAIGHRALAVNLSDLAAMGAQPAWSLLALSLPQADEGWIREFARGFFALAERYQVALVGGNLARGPLNVGVTVHGFVPAGEALTRSGTRPGDQIFVTGYLGDAAAGLQKLQAGADVYARDVCVQRFAFPEPRVEVGMLLRGIASAAIDVSDGLVADLDHVLETSGVGARIELEQLPLSSALLKHGSREQAQALALSGGDDYELCFTVPPERLAILESSRHALVCTLTRIGEITVEAGLHCVGEDGMDRKLDNSGYKHF